MRLPLSEFKSEYKEIRPKIIVSKEKANKHTAINENNCLARQLKIDGYVITEDIPKCDYLVLNDDNDNRTAYFIELKSDDMKHAIKQIENTVDKLKKDLTGYDKNLRIVYSGQVNSGTIMAWKKKNKNAVAKHKEYTEYI